MGYTTPVPGGSDVTAAVELPNLGSAPVTAAPTALVTAPQLPSEAGYDDLLLKQAERQEAKSTEASTETPSTQPTEHQLKLKGRGFPLKEQEQAAAPKEFGLARVAPDNVTAASPALVTAPGHVAAAPIIVSLDSAGELRSIINGTKQAESTEAPAAPTVTAFQSTAPDPVTAVPMASGFAPRPVTAATVIAPPKPMYLRPTPKALHSAHAITAPLAIESTAPGLVTALPAAPRSPPGPATAAPTALGTGPATAAPTALLSTAASSGCRSSSKAGDDSAEPPKTKGSISMM